MPALPGYFGFLDFTGLPVGIPPKSAVKGHGSKVAGKHYIHSILAQMQLDQQAKVQQERTTRKLTDRIISNRLVEKQQRIFQDAVGKMNMYTAIILEECI